MQRYACRSVRRGNLAGIRKPVLVSPSGAQIEGSILAGERDSVDGFGPVLRSNLWGRSAKAEPDKPVFRLGIGLVATELHS